MTAILLRASAVAVHVTRSRFIAWLSLLVCFIAIASGGMTAKASAEDHGGSLVSSYENFMISSPPGRLKLDPFYRKYVDASGIPVVSSGKVPDAALLIARDLVTEMLTERPDVLAAMVQSGARVGVMAIDEGTMDLPEQRDWKKPTRDDPRLTPQELKDYDRIAAMTDREYWNSRARGMGGLYTTAAAENLMGVTGTRYFGETILVHEFSHNILSTLERIDHKFYARVQAAYDHAMKKKLWRGSYAAQNIQEYWAEGTQTWFNSNKAYIVDGKTIVSDAQLKDYDPALYHLLSAVYGKGRHHLDADVFWNSPARFIKATVAE